MRKFLPVLILFCLSFFESFGQGAIAGKVVESESGFEAIGANVVIAGTAIGMATDLDGSYIIRDLQPGTYTVECSYVGFETIQISEVIVKDGETTLLDITLGAASEDLSEVVIVAKSFRNTEAAVLTLQKKAPVVLDGISAAQFSKSGDSDAAAAVRRVTGVTVEGGKYVYVRGLGDRYSKTTLNGSEVPGLDPNRNTVQMDLFPTNLIDNILVYKTFAPNLPGDFSGGYVDIQTKDFPEELTVKASLSMGYNTIGTFNSGLISYQGSSTDFLGFDDGTRAVPGAVETALNTNSIPSYFGGLGNAPENIMAAVELASLTREFDNNWQFQDRANFLDHGLSFSAGNQYDLGKSTKFGLIGALTYSRSYSGYQDGQVGIFELTAPVSSTNSLTDQLNLTGDKSTMEVLWGAMLSGSFKFGSNNKVGLTLMHNQNGASESRFYDGVKARDDSDDNFQTRTWSWNERGLTTGQLKGKHVFSGVGNLELEWRSSVSQSTQETPDLRFFTNRRVDLLETPDDLSDDAYRLKASDNPPTRFYRDMQQINYDNKLDLTLPFKQWNALSSKFMVGFSHVFRDREFREERYNFNNQSFSLPNGDIFAYFADENLLSASPETGYTNNGTGPYLVENVDPRNNYDADQTVTSGYAMFELPVTKNIRVVTGARIENTGIRLATFDTTGILVQFPELDGEQKLIDETDILPSVNINIDLTEKMKLRLAYNKTLARPTFREVAPFTSFDVDGGFLVVGNPALERTLVDNIDLRWEFYPSGGEIISVSGFYKNFENPIERTFNPEAANTELTWRNVESARLFGAEFEVKKNLGFLGKGFENLSVGANFSYIVSNTDIDSLELNLIRTLDPEASDSREMFGQAPYVVNALVSYNGADNGINANLAFNIVGRRLTVITRGATPDYEQKPQPSLNFNFSKKFGKRLSAKFSANNLLAPDYRVVADFKGKEFPIEVYNTPRSFSVGIGVDLK